MIFNKDDNGTEELFEVTGSYWRTNDFSVIRSEIESASTAVRSQIGDALFDRAETHYKSEDFDTADDGINTGLVRKVQVAVATLAMYRYFQQVLSHEDGGRVLKINSETEKNPWAWQLERDDQALLDRHYRALDELFIFVERNKITEWEQSRIFKDRKACLVGDIDAFQRVFPIEDSHRMFHLLVPFMLEAQERYVLPVVGKEGYDAMVAGGELSTELVSQLSAARRYIPLLSVITAVRRMSVKVLPTAIVRRFVDSFQGKGGGNFDREAESRLLRTLEEEAAVAKTELQRAVSQCSHAFTEADLVPKNDPHKKFCSV
jgi:hypothetical protein